MSAPDDEELYACVPTHLRHHFCVDAVGGGDAHERDAIRCARRTRSAHLVATAFAADVPLATAVSAAAANSNAAVTKPSAAAAKVRTKVKASTAAHSAPPPPAPLSPLHLYSYTIEHAITARMTFDRTLARFESLFEDHTHRLERLERLDPSAVVPAWLYDSNTRLATLFQVQRAVVQAVESCVSDADIYVSMYESLPSPPTSSPTPLLRVAVCSSKSAMHGRVLVSAAGALLDRDSPHAPQSNQDDERLPSSAVTASDTKLHYSRDSVSFETMATGRECVVNDIAALAPEQLQRFTRDTVTGPFACFPLPGASDNNSSSSDTHVAIGVLALDSCRKALRLRPASMTTLELSEFLTRMHLRDAAIELRRHKLTGAHFIALTDRDVAHAPAFSALKIATRKRLLELVHLLRRGVSVHLARPAQYFVDDPYAMAFVRDVAQRTGIFLDGYRAAHWHQTMANATRDPQCTLLDVFDVLVRGVARSLDCISRVVVWRIIGLASITAQSPSQSPSQLEIDVVASTDVPDDRLMPFLQWSERLIKRVVLYKESSAMEAATPRLVQGTITRIFAGTSRQSTTSAACEAAQYQISWSNRCVERLTWMQLRQLLPIRSMNAKHFQLTHLVERLQHAAQRSTDVSRRHDYSSCYSSVGVDGDDAEADANDSVVRLAKPHGVALVMHDVTHSCAAQYVLEVDFAHSVSANSANNNSDLSDANTAGAAVPRRVVALLRRAAGITEKSIACVRGRETRRRSREYSAAHVAQTFQSMALTPSRDALRALGDVVACVFAEIIANLPGVELQVAELQSDNAQLRYTFAANGSTLLDKVLQRGQGVSFRCLDMKQPLVVQRGSDDASRLRRLGREPEPDTEFPYVFLPLVHDDCAVGVLSLNRFVDVPTGRHDELHPEAGALEYLTAVAKPLGAALYLKRRAHALYELQTLAREPLRSPAQLFFHACCAVKDVLVGVWKVRVVEVDCARGKTSAVYELSDAERLLAMSLDAQRVAPLRLRAAELLDDTVARHFALSAMQVAELRERISALDAQDMDDSRRIEQLDAATGTRTSSTSTLSSTSSSSVLTESERRRLESKRVAAKYLTLQLDETAAVSRNVSATTVGQADRLSNEKYVTHALGVFLGGSSAMCHTTDVAALARRHTRVFLAVSSLPQSFATCERHYVARVGETLSRLLDDLHQRVDRSRRRVAALESFRAACAHEAAALEHTLVANSETNINSDSTGVSAGKHALSPDDELAAEAAAVLQERAVAMLERELLQPNVYIGLLEPARQRIRYTCASTHSVMRGKRLVHGHGVGFDVLRTQRPCVVTQHDVEQQALGSAINAQTSDTSSSTERSSSDASVDGVNAARRLRFFTTEPLATRKWPFISVPIGALGVLSLDNLERYARAAGESQPELGVVDFVRRVALELHHVLESVRATALRARESRRALALTRIMRVCDDVQSHSLLFVQTRVVHELERALNGVDAYIGLVDPLCAGICFTAASTRSGMAGQRANTVRSASFRVFATQRPLVIAQLRSYLRDQDDAAVARNGKLKVLRSSVSTTFEPTGPFVCVSIPFAGVLTVDTFPGAAGGAYSPTCPERGVVEFISRVANLLGEHLRARSASAAMQRVPALFQGNRSTFVVVARELLLLLASNIVAAESLYVLRLVMRKGDSDSDSDASNQSVLVPLASLTRATTASNTVETIDDTVAQRVREYIEVLKRDATGSTDDSVTVRCIALPEMPEVLLAVLSPTRDVTDVDGAFASTVLVLQRVRNATWQYDLDLLRLLMPLMDDVIAQVNVRVDGIVARRRALCAIDAISEQLDALPPRDAEAALGDYVRDALAHIASGLSRTADCDVYVGERQVGGAALMFTYATHAGGVESAVIDLSDPASAAFVTVQSLEQQRPSVVHLLDAAAARHDKLLRPLSTNRCVRVHIVVPMGDDRVLCADSLGLDAFDMATPKRLERDVFTFFTACATKLRDAILSTHYRRSYDDLVRLKAPTQRHANFRAYFATLLHVVRRGLVVAASQQIVTLAPDFTGCYYTEAWQAAPTPTSTQSRTGHMCYRAQCESALIALGVHFETDVQRPMTNLPRTLDASRSSLTPAYGIERRGAFARACLATMIDADALAPRVAFCVYSHDAQTHKPHGSSSAPPAFTPSQRQFFFALTAVATDVFTHVYRSCLLHSVADEMLFSLRELLGAKDGLVVRVQQTHPTQSDRSDGNDASCVVVCSSQESKFPRESVLPPEPLAAKLLQFAQSATDFVVFVRKKPDATPLAGAAAQSTATEHATLLSASPTKTAPSRSFFKRPVNLFGSRKAGATPTLSAASATLHDSATTTTTMSAAATATAGSRDSQLPSQPRYKFHVLVRGVSVFGSVTDILSFDVERRSLDSAKALEQIARRWREQTRSIVDAFLTRTPRGDEPMLRDALGPDAHSDAYHVGCSSGYFLLTHLAQVQQRFQQQSLRLETDIRGFLTGVQPTARGIAAAVVSTRVALPVDAQACPLPFDQALSVFADDDVGDRDPAASQVTAAALALIRVAMALVGYRKEALARMDKRAALTEFLRASVVKKLVAIDPRDRLQWPSVQRAKALLAQVQDTISALHMPLAVALPQHVAATMHQRDTQHSEPATAATALCAMSALLAALIAVVRYEKQLEADATRERERLDRHAAVLQCCVRSAHARAALRQRRLEFAAARTIQCAFRQHLARRRALFLRWVRAATTIQRAYRLKLQRRKGTRPKRLSDELHVISKQFGGLSTAPSHASGGAGIVDLNDNGAWRVEMDAFETFSKYLASRAGKEQLQHEQRVMTARMHELTRARAKLPLAQRVVEDAADLFALLDTGASGELSRDAMREMMARLHVPLAPAEMDDVLAMMDSDASGGISLHEFTSWFAHEYPVLKLRSRDCGVVARKDWQWVIERSAREVLRKRYRALRLGRQTLQQSPRSSGDRHDVEDVDAVDNDGGSGNGCDGLIDA